MCDVCNDGFIETENKSLRACPHCNPVRQATKEQEQALARLVRKMGWANDKTKFNRI